jgi:hypothetical protein
MSMLTRGSEEVRDAHRAFGSGIPDSAGMPD